jgi:uncharacterized protein (DUF2141 family)
MLQSVFQTKKKLLYFAILTGIYTALLWDCAYKVAPSGGPEDKTPPEIIYTFPSQDSINIKELSYLEFHFSESVDKASLSNQTWLLPELADGYEIKWKGSKKLRVILKDSLEKDQTYIFTIGTGVKDLQRNSLHSPFVLPFSTGSKIDRGEISGRVFDKKSQGIFIYAYEVSDTFSAQTVFEKKPRYYTQTGNSGDYQLKYLKESNYRIYALEDQNLDRKYTLQTDRIGIPFMDITISAEQVRQEQINFHLIREDTTRPKFLRVDTLNNRAIKLSFDEPLGKTRNLNIQILDSLNRASLSILATVLDKNEPNHLVIYTKSQKNVRYVGMISTVQDTAGNFSEEDTIRFNFLGAMGSDTTSTKLVGSIPPDNGKDVAYDSDVKLNFYYPVDSSSLENGFQLLSPDSVPVVGHWEFESLVQPKYMSDSLLGKNAVYHILLDLKEVKTIFGNSIGDSLLISHFKTKDWEQLGEIAGVVSSDNPHYKKALIWAFPMQGAGNYSTSAEIGQKYQIPFLPEGQYRIQAGIDVNQNGKLDNGSELHFEYSEPFKVLPDTIKVRKRWTTEEINISF